MERDGNLDPLVPLSSPDLVRNFQAAFKRHRSLVSGSTQANNMLPKRAILPKRGSGKAPPDMKFIDEVPPQSEQEMEPQLDKKVQFQGADCSLARGPANLSSHMASLAVTETDSATNPKLENPAKPLNNELHHLNFIAPQTCSSSATTTLIHSSSAPASNSTTHCSLKDVPSNENPPPVKEKQSAKNAEKSSRKRGYDPDLFFKVNGKLYQKLGKIGSGGSSEVHKVISSECNIYALKKIKLKGRDYGTAYDFCQEIDYLNKLKGKKNIIQLIDYEVTDSDLLTGRFGNKNARVKDDAFIFMVLEYGEIDLAHMLIQKRRETEDSNSPLDENWLRFYWQQILESVNTIHEERIVHSDLKPANFLLVKGSLKLIDFGIAKSINSDTTNIQRDSQVGTLSYMSPEAFLCNERDGDGNVIKCGRGSDIWSLGCILYQMVYGRTPFADHKVFWAKVKIITDPNHKIGYDPVANLLLVDLMQKCLVWDQTKRWRIPQLLQHPFLSPPMPRQVVPLVEELWDVIEDVYPGSVKARGVYSEIMEMIRNPYCDQFSERKAASLLQSLKVCLLGSDRCS